MVRKHRPSFATAFFALLGLFNLVATWVGPVDIAPIYGAGAIACFGVLATRMSNKKGLR
ncbi:MAG: hypothetical protein AAGF71_05735 [Pseudomonadota bacterium]